MLEFRLLGPLEVLEDGRPVPLPRAKQRALLAVLLLHAGETLSADRLIDELWGERPPATAKGSLQNLVSQLRKALGAHALRTRDGAYALVVDAGQIDAGRFEQLLRAAQDCPPADRARKLLDALAEWRGPALGDLAFESFATLEAGRLEELRIGAVEDLVDARIALGEHAEVVPELEVLAAEHPLRERVREQLILALYRSGRQAEALEAYASARRMLLEELGLEPGPALRELQQAILRHDESLLAPGTGQPTTERRKLVTLVWAAVTYPPAADDEDPEFLQRRLDRALGAVRAAATRHGGSLRELPGDEALVVFGAPEGHEDDAERAARAADEMRRAVDALDSEPARDGGVRLRLRAGISSGYVVAAAYAGGPLRVTGGAVNVAKLLARSAEPGAVLLDATTLPLVRDVASTEPAGSLPGSPPTRRLVGIRSEEPAIVPRLDEPLIGRARELGQLDQAFERVRDERRCVVRAVVGEPGIGKSRLAAELCARLEPSSTILVARCGSYGPGATWPPLVRALVRVLGDPPGERLEALVAPDPESARIVATVSQLLGAEVAPPSPGEAFWAVRRVLESLAAGSPVVLVLEDVHWATPTMLDLVEYLEGFVRAAPLLVIALARPELLDDRPGWAPWTSVLPALDPAEVRAMIESRAPPGLGAEVRAAVAARAAGNPLFVEQLLARAAETGGVVDMPASLEALLQSRVDSLSTEERSVLELAAVVGRELTQGSVGELADAAVQPSVGALLLALVRRGLLDPASGAAPREIGFRFHHALVRDVAYAGIPKARRAELHELVAGQLERESGGDGLVGHHLEQAYRYRAELGPVDRHARALADDAGVALGRAGVQAWKRADAPATVDLLSRATSLLRTDGALRRNLGCELGLALRHADRPAEAASVWRETIADAGTAADVRAELRARLELVDSELSTPAGVAVDEVVRLATSAVAVFESVGDHRALGRAWVVLAYAEGGLRCDNAAWARASELAAAHYELAGWPTALPLCNLAAALYHGPTPVGAGVDRCRALLEGATLFVRANVLLILATFAAHRSRLAEARTLVGESVDGFAELGYEGQLVDTVNWARAEVELVAGDPGEAELALRRLCAKLERVGAYTALASRAGELAEALYRQGRDDEAERWTHTAELRARRDDVSAMFPWRGVRAKVLARRGRHAEAVAAAREAVAIVERTDARAQHAKALLDLGEVLLRADRPDEASITAREARRLYRLKESAAGVERADDLLRALSQT